MVEGSGRDATAVGGWTEVVELVVAVWVWWRETKLERYRDWLALQQ